MNRIFLLLYFMLVSGLLSYSSNGNSNETVKAVEKTDHCRLDSKNTYEVYVPERENSKEILPLLVIIDSHGSGKFALDKFKPAANQYPVVLIASNLIKNGFEGYEKAMQTLIEDVRQKYPVGNTIFMTGFSGGARMALGYGLTHQLNGLILCGALANSDQIDALRCPVISISGMDDFNFIETAQFLFQDQLTPGNLKIELTNASHSWPDSLLLANAFGFLKLSCQSKEIPPFSKSKLDSYCQNQQARINSLKLQGDFLKASLIASNMSSTQPFNDDKTFASIYHNLTSGPEYISQMDRLEKSLNYEISKRQPYLEAFQAKDTLWWKNEIRTVDEKIRTETDSYTKDMYRRIKGFWGIACYSLCKQSVKNQNSEALKKILTIYSNLEPKNPDMFYFSAFPYFWRGNVSSTCSMLKKAIGAGFTDLGQLKTDFPEAITSKLY